MKQYRSPQTSALLTVSSLLLGFLFRPFSWLIFSTHLTAATLSSVERKHICTILKDDSCCHLRPNRSVEAEWIGAVTPFPKALTIHEKILKVCKCNFCCCRCFCLVGFFAVLVLCTSSWICHYGDPWAAQNHHARKLHSGLPPSPPCNCYIPKSSSLHTHRRPMGPPIPQSETGALARTVQEEFWLCRVTPPLWAAALWSPRWLKRVSAWECMGRTPLDCARLVKGWWGG